MMSSLNLFSPPKVTIKRRRYVSYDDDDDDNGNESETSATTTATDTVVTCEYHDDLDNEYSCPRLTKRQRQCITLVPSSFTNRSRLFVPILEDSDTTHQEERGSPPPSLPFAYRQEEEDERRDGAGRSIYPSNDLFDETTPFLQPKEKKKISLLQDIEQEEQQYDIEQGQEQQQGSRCCSMHPVVYHNNSNNSNPSPLPASRRINKSTRSSSSCSSNYLQSYPRYGSPKGTHQHRQRQTSRRVVLPSPSPFLPSSSPFPVVEDTPGSSTTTTTTDVVLIEDTIVEQFQRATRLTEEQEELPLSTTTTSIQTSPSFDIMLRY